MALTLVALLTACGSSGSGVGQAGQDRCRQLVAADRNPFSRHQAFRRCLASIEAVLEKEAAKVPVPDPEPSLQAAVKRCQERRPTVSELMASLRRQERRLADVRLERYVPATPRPRFDEDAEARFRLEDQQLDRERYEAALEAWEAKDAARRDAWAAGRRRRLAEAQHRLNQTTRELRAMEPELFTSPTSIEFVPAVAQRLRSCDPKELERTTAADAASAQP